MSIDAKFAPFKKTLFFEKCDVGYNLKIVYSLLGIPIYTKQVIKATQITQTPYHLLELL
jgi:hypothetical protein